MKFAAMLHRSGAGELQATLYNNRKLHFDREICMKEYRILLLKILLAGLIILGIGAVWSIYMNHKNAYGEEAEAEESEPVFDNLSELLVYPSGEPMGIYLKTDGVMVVDTGEFLDSEGAACCPAGGILESGDYITAIDGQSVSSKAELMTLVNESDGMSMEITFVRNEKEQKAYITPELSQKNGYLLGIWVKDDISGIGTVTFIYEDMFMALGHSVSDNDTGFMLRAAGGGVYTTTISKIDKGEISIPGQLEGNIVYKRDLIGTVKENLSCGIIGELNMEYVEENYKDSEKLYVAASDEVETGKAYLYSRLTGEPELYEIMIQEINYDSDSKNLEIQVTDSRLLELTGGIVQGMSGTPIIQNGKLIGAVTHVLVDDPTRGYGIFIENMLEQ
jgi:stage IV sporulation protein B